jgi:hypothetical protein
MAYVFDSLSDCLDVFVDLDQGVGMFIGLGAEQERRSLEGKHGNSSLARMDTIGHTTGVKWIHS